MVRNPMITNYIQTQFLLLAYDLRLIFFLQRYTPWTISGHLMPHFLLLAWIMGSSHMFPSQTFYFLPLRLNIPLTWKVIVGFHVPITMTMP